MLSGNRHVGSNPTLSANSLTFGSVVGGSGRLQASRHSLRSSRSARIPPSPQYQNIRQNVDLLEIIELMVHTGFRISDATLFDMSRLQGEPKLVGISGDRK